MGNALHTKGAGTAGVTDHFDARLDDAGLIAVGSGGLVSARTGVLVGPGATALVTGTSSTAPMRYSVAAHHWVTNRGVVSDGVYRGAAETAKLVDTTAAPGTGSRIDVVWVKQNDAGSTISPDATSAPVYGCTQGTSSTGTPAVPAIPVGAEELARVTVTSAATRTDGAGVTITQTAKLTVARGADVPVRSLAERDALTKYVGLAVVRLDVTGIPTERWTGTAWAAGGDVPVLASIAARNTYFSGNLHAGASALVARRLHVYDGSAWCFSLSGLVTSTTDGSGIIVVTHNAGQAPVGVQLTAVDSGDTVNNRVKWQVQSAGANDFQARASRDDTNTYWAGAAMSFYWQADF